jgi:hypothetical protein
VMRSLWRAIALFAYRRWARAESLKPTGIPGNRDPESPCDGYAPRRREIGNWACSGDGHYLCHGCAHHVGDVEETAWKLA